jgi:transcriptional regulator with XRE-family HTH domain
MYQQLGQVIAAQRKRLNMSQEQLAREAGIAGGRSAMSRIESGQRQLSIEQLAAVAAVFGMRGSALLALAEGAVDDTAHEAGHASHKVPYTVVGVGDCAMDW